MDGNIEIDLKMEERDDSLVKVKPLLRMVDDWRQFLSDDVSNEEHEVLRLHERMG
jgi:hypothetical protein